MSGPEPHGRLTLPTGSASARTDTQSETLVRHSSPPAANKITATVSETTAHRTNMGGDVSSIQCKPSSSASQGTGHQAKPASTPSKGSWFSQLDPSLKHQFIQLNKSDPYVQEAPTPIAYLERMASMHLSSTSCRFLVQLQCESGPNITQPHGMPLLNFPWLGMMP